MKVTKRPLRVLYVDTAVGLAGGQTALLEILKFLDRASIVPIVASPQESALSLACSKLGVPWVRLPFASAHLEPCKRRGLVGPLRDLAASARGALELARYMRRDKIDILHANTFKAGLVGAVATSLCPRRMVFHDRTLFGHMPIGLFVGAKASRIVAVSQAAAAKYGGRFAAKLRIIPDSVDVERFEPGDVVRPERPLVGYLGRISEEKGVIHFVRCAPKVLERFPSARFVIAGSPFTMENQKYLHLVRHEVERLGLDAAFQFVGHTDDPLSFLRGLNLLVVPSEKEGLGRAMLEAMALGKPVVVFAAGGPSEVISDGTDGLLVPLGDVTALSLAVVRLLREPGLAEAMGRAARRTVLARHSSRVQTASLVEVYAEICSGRDQ